MEINTINYQLLLKIPTEKLLNMCFKGEIQCDNDNFWYHKVVSDFSINIASRKSPDLSYKNYLIELLDIENIPIYYNQEEIGGLYVRYTNTNYEVFKEIVDFFKKHYFGIDENSINIWIINSDMGKTKNYNIGIMNNYMNSNVYMDLIYGPTGNKNDVAAFEIIIY